MSDETDKLLAEFRKLDAISKAHPSDPDDGYNADHAELAFLRAESVELRARIEQLCQDAKNASETLRVERALMETLETRHSQVCHRYENETERLRAALRECRLPPAIVGRPETYVVSVDARAWNDRVDAALGVKP